MQVFELPTPEIPPGLVELMSAEIRPEALNFSPDGRLLAAWNQGLVVVLDTALGTARVLWSKRDSSMASVPGIAFTADGCAVVARHLDYDRDPRHPLQVHDVESGTVLREFAHNQLEAIEPGPGGRLVYLGNPFPGANGRNCALEPAHGKAAHCVRSARRIPPTTRDLRGREMGRRGERSGDSGVEHRREEAPEPRDDQVCRGSLRYHHPRAHALFGRRVRGVFRAEGWSGNVRTGELWEVTKSSGEWCRGDLVSPVTPGARVQRRERGRDRFTTSPRAPS